MTPLLPKNFQYGPFDLPDTADQTEPGPLSPNPGYTTPTSWASTDPTTFYGIRDLVQQQFGQYVGLDATEVGRALEEFGRQYFQTNRFFPTVTDVQRSGEFLVTLERRAVRSDVLPPIYAIDTPQGRIIYSNRATSVLPVALTPTQTQHFEPAKPGNVPGSKPGLEIGAPGTEAIQTMTPEEVNNILNLEALQPKPTGGSGASVRYDKDQLAEAIRDRWRTLLREEPADPYSLANQFISDANSALRQGSTKDFETWVLNKIRATDKYTVLYGKKDPSQSEVDYLQSFLNITGQYGLRASDANRIVKRGLKSGAAPASFAEQVAGSKAVEGLGTGDLSRRFANLLGQLGMGA